MMTLGVRSSLWSSQLGVAVEAMNKIGAAAEDIAAIGITNQRDAVDLPEMKIHFDGTTQWTHSVPDAEITIVTPTDAEIAQINPLAFLGSLRGEFNVSDLSGGNVRLLPKDTSSGIDEIVALFSNSTGWPVQIRMTSSGHTALIDQITVTTLDKPLPPSTFTVTPAKGVTVVDLR